MEGKNMLSFSQYLLGEEEEEEIVQYPDGVYISVRMREESVLALRNYANKSIL
jgi:hypothetical protein